MDDFLALVEHMLNTVLFTLGGLVWGEVISNVTPGEQFTGKDWGYLFVLYIFLMLIRCFLMFSCYPITASIGLGTNLQETVFSSFAGLRGAVGIALAIFLDNLVGMQDIPFYANEVNRLFGFVGGIAFLTLTVNATLSGPLLRKLGLADKAAIRQKVFKIMHFRLRKRLIQDMVTLLSEPRFHRVNFAIVRHHIPLLEDLSLQELESAVGGFKRPERKFLDSNSVPNLSCVTPYLKESEEDENGASEIDRLLQGLSECSDGYEHRRHSRRRHGGDESRGDEFSAHSLLDTVECRHLFLEILRASYALQVEMGELADRDFLVKALNHSLEFAREDICRGLALDDWSHTDLVKYRYSLFQRASKHISRFVLGEKIKHNLERHEMQYEVDRCVAFLECHRRSREVFKSEFLFDVENMTEAEATVLQESEATCSDAVALLESFPTRRVETIVTHRFCTILLNVVAQYFENLAKIGLLSSKEAEDFLELIQEMILGIEACKLDDEHPGELPMPS
ncbi:sodium/hydrogen exchanger family-like protein [Fragilaria crotonensis]|nr:sodium/hydrogen exchanger family-like protein [Fragilaria crotonensis]